MSQVSLHGTQLKSRVSQNTRVSRFSRKNIQEEDKPLPSKRTLHISQKQYFSKLKKERQKEDLNNWKLCNPQIYEDFLPQPFRFITGIIYDDIYLKVSNKIHDIEKKKLNPSYDANLRCIQPSGVMDINGITCFDKTNNHKFENIVITGDKFGQIQLLDLNKKQVIGKLMVSKGKRITQISSQTSLYGDNFLTTVAVLSRGDRKVNIFRYRDIEYKIKHHFEINVSKELNQIPNENEEEVVAPTKGKKAEVQQQEEEVTDGQNIPENTDISNFPFEVSMSPDGQFCSVTLYSGDVQIFKIMDPPILTLELPQKKTKYQRTTNTNPNNILQQKAMQKMKQKQNQHSSFLNFQLHAIDEPFLVVKARFPQKPLTEEQILKFYFEQNVKKATEEEEVDPKAKAKARKGKGKGKQEAESIEEVKEEKIEFLFEVNPPVPFGKCLVSEQGEDLSSDLPRPKYFPQIFFQTRAAPIPHEHKYFGRLKSAQVSVGVICVWLHCDIFDVYKLLPQRVESVPYYMKKKYYKLEELQHMQSNYFINQEDGEQEPESKDQETKKPTKQKKQEDVTEEPAEQQTDKENPYLLERRIDFKPYLYSSPKMLYPIQTSAINKSSTFLSLGLQDGSVVIWDLNLNTTKCFLDKHRKAVTCIKWYEDWFVISGSKDGTVNMYDITTQELKAHRENTFEAVNNSIQSISVSESGMVIVTDTVPNVKFYSMPHFEKITRVSTNIESQQKRRQLDWWTSPRVEVHAMQQQFCLIAKQVTQQNRDKSSPKSPDMENDSPYSKNDNCVMIFRIFDNMIYLFPALEQNYRKGYHSKQMMNLFTRLTYAELKDPNYIMPHLLDQANVMVGDKQSTKNMSKREMQKSKMMSMKSALRESKMSIADTSDDFSEMNASQMTGFSQSQYSQFDMNQSFASVIPSKVTSHEKQFKIKQKGGLTKEQLHPEKFFFKKKIVPATMVHEEISQTLQGIEERQKDKIGRNERIKKMIIKLEKNLALENERLRLEKQRNLLKM